MKRFAMAVLCLASTHPCQADDEVRIQVYHLGIAGAVEDYFIDEGQSHSIQSRERRGACQHLAARPVRRGEDHADWWSWIYSTAGGLRWWTR